MFSEQARTLFLSFQFEDKRNFKEYFMENARSNDGLVSLDNKFGTFQQKYSPIDKKELVEELQKLRVFDIKQDNFLWDIASTAKLEIILSKKTDLVKLSALLRCLFSSKGLEQFSKHGLDIEKRKLFNIALRFDRLDRLSRLHFYTLLEDMVQ